MVIFAICNVVNDLSNSMYYLQYMQILQTSGKCTWNVMIEYGNNTLALVGYYLRQLQNKKQNTCV